nr:winged helix-turn-helix domain-containing protein [Natronorubrum halophilum]
MTTNSERTDGRDYADDLEDLPSDGQRASTRGVPRHARAIGHRTRYEICYRLVHDGEMSPKELEEAIGIDDSTLHYRLNKLLEVDLVEKRQRTERGQDGLYTYYRATVFGEVVLTDGVDGLSRSERAFEAMCDGSLED